MRVKPRCLINCTAMANDAVGGRWYRIRIPFKSVSSVPVTLLCWMIKLLYINEKGSYLYLLLINCGKYYLLENFVKGKNTFQNWYIIYNNIHHPSLSQHDFGWLMPLLTIHKNHLLIDKIINKKHYFKNIICRLLWLLEEIMCPT